MLNLFLYVKKRSDIFLDTFKFILQSYADLKVMPTFYAANSMSILGVPQQVPPDNKLMKSLLRKFDWKEVYKPLWFSSLTTQAQLRLIEKVTDDGDALATLEKMHTDPCYAAAFIYMHGKNMGLPKGKLKQEEVLSLLNDGFKLILGEELPRKLLYARLDVVNRQENPIVVIADADGQRLFDYALEEDKIGYILISEEDAEEAQSYGSFKPLEWYKNKEAIIGRESTQKFMLILDKGQSDEQYIETIKQIGYSLVELSSMRSEEHGRKDNP